MLANCGRCVWCDTRTVVQSSLAILILDFILTAFMFRELRMERSTVDLWVGAFVVAGIAALVVLALKVET